MRSRLYVVVRSFFARVFKMDFVLTPITQTKPRVGGDLTETFVPSVGLTMALDLAESLDACYAMNVVDDVCIDFVRRHLQHIEYFVDVGANQGLYTCVVLKESSHVEVVALEPDPYSQEKLWKNVALNSLESNRLTLITDAVGEANGEAELMLNVAGNRGGSSLLIDQRPFTGLTENVSIPVTVRSLASVTEQVAAGSWMLKLDIEGMEFPVLRSFLNETEPASWPDFVIVEAFGRLIATVGGSPVELLVRRGFTLVDHDGSNFCLAAPSRGEACAGN